MQKIRDSIREWLDGISPFFQNVLIAQIAVIVYPALDFVTDFSHFNFYYAWLSAILFFAYQIGFIWCFARNQDLFLGIAMGIRALTSLTLFVKDPTVSKLVCFSVYGFLTFFFIRSYSKIGNQAITSSVKKEVDVEVASKNKRLCTKCGAELLPDATFCTACGAKQTNDEEQAPQKPQPVCKNCGNVIKEDAAFCNICGTKVE